MSETNFAFLLKYFCARYGASISSTHRTTKHNRQVGGAPNSQHLKWKAADLILDDPAQRHPLIKDLKDAGFFVLDETETKQHVHVDDRYNADY